MTEKPYSPAPSAGGSELSPQRVLIVDDDAVSRKTAEGLLSPVGYHIRSTTSGEEALAEVEREPPDLVLLDVLMPGLNGFEVCRRLRERLRGEYIPIILVTGMDEQRDIVRGLEAGADDFLRKPIHGPELRARVSNLLKVRAYHQLLASERDRALATVEVLRQQLLRADRLATLGTFAAGVSHELKNIAQVLRGALDATSPISSGGAGLPATEAKELLTDVASHVANHVLELSGSILRIARPNESTHSETNLCRTLEEVRDMLRLTGRTRHALVNLVLPSEPCLIHSNPVHAQQVFLNLLSNAADAVSTVPEPRIEVGVQTTPEGHIEAWVQDNGPGIPPEVLARMFEPFFTTKPPGSGTGLGLPVVKQIIESWGGKLHVQSEPGRGARMVIDIPAAQGA